MQFFVCVVYVIEKLHAHALLHSSDKLPGLYKLSNGSLAIKPPRYSNFHRAGNLLYLPKPILIDHRLRLVNSRAWAHCRDGCLLLRVLKDQTDSCVRGADGYIYFVGEVEQGVEYVVDRDLGHRYFLRSVPERVNLRTRGTGDLRNGTRFFTRDAYLWLQFP